MDGAKSFEGRSLDKAKKGGRRRRIKDILITAMRVSTKAEEEEGRKGVVFRWYVGGILKYTRRFVC